MEGSSFEEDLPDFIGDIMMNNDKPSFPRSGKGMATSVYTEMMKQLEQASGELARWFSEIVQVVISPDLVESLHDGTVLCQVAQLLYPSYPLGEWILYPQCDEDYSINLTLFAQHCLGIGIHQDLIISQQQFDDNDIAKLTTCLLEYRDRYYILLQEQDELEHAQEQAQTQAHSSPAHSQPIVDETSVMNTETLVQIPLLSEGEESTQSKDGTCCQCCGCTFM